MNSTLFKQISIILFIAMGAISFSGCEKVFEVQQKDGPVDVFNDLWKFMDEHYALFEVKEVDWLSIRNKYQSRVSISTTSSELFKVCADMLEELKDGHVSLITETQTATYDNFYKSYPVNFNYQNIVRNYLKNSFEQTGPFIYKIEQGVGYLNYSSFNSNFSDNELDKVFDFLAAAKGLIIDVRSNTGGAGTNVNRLTARFLPARLMTKYELIKNGPGHNDFNDPRAFFLDPFPKIYSQPVVVLTNRTCFSACNDFVLYMSLLNQVKIAGDQTGGGGSIPANYILLNGWKLQYSSSVTWNPSKQPVEQGIQPDFRINISPIDETNGFDPILEKAFSLLR